MIAAGVALVAVLAADAPVKLRLNPCTETDAPNVSRLLGIELGALAGAHPIPDVEIVVEVACRDELTVVRVFDPVTDKTLERVLRLRRAAPQARSRLLALAIVELLVASWAELAAAPQATPAPTAATTPAREAAQAIAAERLQAPSARVSMLLEGGGTNFFTPVGLTGGGGLRVIVDLPGRLGAAVGLRMDRAVATRDLGSVTFESLSLAPVALARAALGPITARGGVGARVGLGRMTGDARDPERTTVGSFSAAWAGPMVTSGLGARFWRRLTVELAIEAGYVALPLGARVAHVRDVTVEGPWLGAALGLGWAL